MPSLCSDLLEVTEFGPGLDEVLAHHHRLPAVRGELLLRAGRGPQAVAELERALALVPDTAERHHLESRLAEARTLPA